MKKLGLLIVLSIMMSTVYSQQRIVYGKVISFNEFPVANIVVNAKKSKASVKTDSLGMFSIACEKKDVLVFNSNSFYVLRKKVGINVDTVNVNLIFKEDNSGKNELSAISYGYMKKEDLSYAITTLKNEKMDCLIYNTIYDMIRGQIPGVQVRGSSIVIRGSVSFFASSQALLVVDDVVVSDISHILPCDVKSISALKDASSSGYGSRGANGVIKITTKLN